MKIPSKDYPQAYVDKYKYFFKDKFAVNKHTLIPRKETEFLVEKALELIPSNTQLSIADIGTGSGCIAISILHTLEEAWQVYKQVNIYAFDISVNALRVAEKNKETILTVSKNNLTFKHNNLLQGIEEKFNIICVNLPYIPSERMHLLPHSVQIEPRIALDGGYKGIEIIYKLIKQSTENLLPNGYIIFEADPEQMPLIEDFVRNIFKSIEVEIIKDYSKNDRIICIQFTA